MIAAGGMLTPGKIIKAGEMWGGSPARKMRDLTEQQQAINNLGTMHYAQLAPQHADAVNQS